PASAGYQRCLRGLYRVQAAKPEGETAPMPAPIRPRRSVLFMPGSNPRALEKARALPADALIFDLEDAVAPEAKETARAAIAAASPCIGALVLGTSDLANDLHARPARDRLPLLTALGLVLLAARAHGRAVLDGVHLDLADAEGFAAACRQGRELGFDGKT